MTSTSSADSVVFSSFYSIKENNSRTNNRIKRLNKCSDDWYYDPKCKENTQRRKGKAVENKYLQKKLFKLKIEWKNENLEEDIKTSIRKNKRKWLPEYKQNNLKNFSKSTQHFQPLRDIISLD
jgi:hypothetical protein